MEFLTPVFYFAFASKKITIGRELLALIVGSANNVSANTHGRIETSRTFDHR
jgi:hypothetical protein